MLQASNGQSYRQCDEELPVTLQVGLIASDGWVLASDRFETFETGKMRLGSGVNKLRFDETSGVACCCSGDEWAREARDRLFLIIADKGPGFPGKILTEIGDKIWTEIPEKERPRADRKLIFGNIHDPKHFYLAHIREHTKVTQKPDFVTAGDDQNPAHFFIQHYYVKGAGTTNTVDQLKLLAAHTILMAARHNHRVQGLEMIVCRDSRYEDVDIEKIIQDSEALEQSLTKQFGVTERYR
jgi:hypothetical protein